MKIIFTINIIFLTIVNIYGQFEDFNEANRINIKEGIYIDFEQVKENTPIDKNFIVTSIPLNSADFYKKLTQQEKIYFFDSSGVKKQIDTKNIWGYSIHNNIYINYNERFFKIPALGSISQFLAKVKVVRTETDPMYGGYYGYPTRTYETEETKYFLLSFKNGQIYDYNYKSLEVLLKDDPQLYEEYSKLKKRLKRKLMYKYINEYNKKHPLKFKGTE